MPNHMRLVLAGTGATAVEYARVLAALNFPFTAVGRGTESVAEFARVTGVAPVTGGAAQWLRARQEKIDTAIVAVSGDQLAPVTLALVDHGVRRLLVEKPAGIDSTEIRSVAKRAAQAGADVRVGYNRRFFASVRQARKIMESDGPGVSMHFEFTEWADRVQSFRHPPGVLENWLLANSTHVIDTAFFLCGVPVEMVCYAGGGLPWHRNSIYTGAGVTRTGARFSYHANWHAPGRWGIEIMTTRHRLVFRPMETLQVQELGKSEPWQMPEDDLDRRFKPGFYRQTEAFLTGSVDAPPSITEHVEHLGWYDRINASPR